MRLSGLLAIATFSIALSATAVFSAADPLTHQGRLLDASDQPVSNGTHTLVFRLYNVPAGGASLWTESRDVVTSSGLYSTELGTINSLSEVISSHTDEDLYLEIAVGGVTLTPRQRLGVVPTATVARGVKGGYYAVLLGTGSHSLSSSSAGSELALDWDSDNDGTSDGEASMRLTPTTSSMAIKTKGTGAAHNRAATTTYPDSAIQVVGSDLDGDGISETEVSSSSNPTGASHSLHKKGLNAVNVKLAITSEVDDAEARHTISSDPDEDGDPDGEIFQSVTPTTSSVAIKTKGTGADANRLVQVSGSTGAGGAVYRCEIDDDGDTVPDQEISHILTPTTSSMAIKTKGTGAAHGRTALSSTSTLLGEVATVSTVDDDGDGSPDSEISQVLTPTTSSVAIKTKGTGADKDRTIGSGCDDSSAVHEMDIDDDGDGVSEARVVSSVSSLPAGGGAAAAAYAATGRYMVDSDDDGDPEGEIESFVTPGTCSVAIKTKGTGADKNRVINQSDSLGALTEVAAGGKNIGLYVNEVSGSCALTMVDGSLGTQDTTIVIDGALKRFGIGLSQPSYPLHHSSGAHLTVGGDWINASDENLKENFQPVDGQELLEKIEELPIAEWNYRSESDDVKHIGPTAQDFKEKFGVGSDGISISTIDPSGIALAAIKELSKQNRELKEQNAEMKRELDEIKKALAGLRTKK